MCQNWHVFYSIKIMSLAKYNAKRSFDKAPEPTGGKLKDSKLHFVVQKHHASVGASLVVKDL
jgi:hypothetical protein